jgi:transmembrane 9 superfamily protein 2/4
VDEVSHTEEAAAMRHYQLRKKKRSGFLRKTEASLAHILFPGVSPNDYRDNEVVEIWTDLVNSKKTQVPFEYYDLPVCPVPPVQTQRARKNLGSRLQGHENKPAPYPLHVKRSHGCRPICSVQLGGKQLKWLRKLVERQYRVHLNLDQLPVLMRSKELNYAVRGYPLGFQAPPTGNNKEEFYLYNHLKFLITYQEDPSSFDGIRITGFDVHPVSIAHSPVSEEVQYSTMVDSCNADSAKPVTNDPSTYLALRTGPTGEPLSVIYSFQVEWKASDLPWADRWDVYLIGSPDDDIHYFAIVNSLMIVLFLTGAIATIMIRTLRRDIAGYNEVTSLEEAQEETGWKLVHADVFRPPIFSPMLLSVLVGTGAQLGMASFMSMMCAIFKLLNPLKKGQTLTALLVLYVLSGSVAGYVSARFYKFCQPNEKKSQDWKINTLYTAVGLPGVLVSIFCILNVVLSFAGAATAVSFLTILALFALWVCVSMPLVFVGSYLGFVANKLDVPTKISSIARSIPPLPWYSQPPLSVMLGGILPFGSVCIELFFIMSALWLHQLYYVMGFLLVVLLILAATCAEVAIVMCYLQLCSEDHRWWWKSFWNCASAGVYLFLYSLWFLSSRLDLVGVLPVVVYLTYMSMISVCFGLFCGAIGVLMCFWFNRTIYGALKVD